VSTLWRTKAGGRSPLPWGRPRHEFLLLVLVAAAGLSVVQRTEGEDVTRACLTQALVDGRVTIDGCAPWDAPASADGHIYSNVPPGYSAIAIPVERAVRLPAPPRWSAEPPGLKLWAVRLAAAGAGFLVCAFLVGRLAEGLQPGFGGATLVTFALGTIASAVAPSGFDHLPATAFAFGAFALAWGRRPLLAGLAAGLALPIEYQAGLIAVVVGAYVLREGPRSLGLYALGVIPGAALIGAYDWAAFGSPLQTSYGDSPSQSKEGLAGVQFPTLHGIHLVFAGDQGLLVTSPVLVAAVLGLVFLWRRGARAETAVCGLLAVAFLALDCGYFLPYGGDSPGPRFVVPALPFLALGLAEAFARLRTATAGLAVVSIVASTAMALTWPAGVNSMHGYGGTVWRYLFDLFRDGSGALITSWLQGNVLERAGIGSSGAALVVVALTTVAVAVALRDGWKASAELS
jgi:hypothetical protein